MATVLVGLISALFSGCVKNQVTKESQVKLVSESTEIEIGKKAKSDIIKQYGTYKDLTWQVYLDRVGQRVARQSDRPQLPYDFTILDTDMLNAFALPGGFIFVTRGLLVQASDEAELSIVLGHEITHSAAFHGVDRLQKAGALKVLTLGGAVGGMAVGAGGEALAIAQAASVYEELYLLGYGRDKELEADRYGILYAAKTGYDPQAAYTFFERLAQDEEAEQIDHQISPYWRSHPPTRERLKHARQWMDWVEKNYPGREYNRDAYQEMVRRLEKPAPERGTIQGRIYTNPAYGVQLEVPENWTLDNGPASALVIAKGPVPQSLMVLQRVSVPASMGVIGFARKIAKEWGLQKMTEREVEYPAGRGLLWRYGGGGMSSATLLLVHGTTGYLLSCRMPKRDFPEHALDWERTLRNLRIEKT